MTSYRFGYVSLTILHVYSQDQGIYTCRAVNELGEDVTSCQLTVVGKQLRFLKCRYDAYTIIAPRAQEKFPLIHPIAD